MKRKVYFLLLILAMAVYSAISSQASQTEIDKKYAELGGPGGFLGSPTTSEQACSDGKGRFRKYEKGVICWSPNTGAHEMHGPILDKWKALGSGNSPIGYPVTDQLLTSTGEGCYNNFQYGAIYWSPHTGANAVYGVGDWESRVNLTSSQYQAEFDKLVAQGYLPTCVQGAGDGSGARFTAIFARRVRPKAREFRVTGEQVSGLNAFDEAMEDIIKRNGVRSGSLALAKDGRLVYARAFTWAEDDYNTTLPENIFRIASCSKPLTAVAIYQLMEAGRLNLDDRLIDHINLDLPPGASVEARFNRITIRNLLQHKSGIVRNTASDEDVLKFFTSKGVPKTLPLGLSDVAAYMATVPLLYDPGNPPPGDGIYSNTGFLFLSLIVEQMLGSYLDYVNQNIFDKIGVTRAQVTGSETTDQGLLEVVYYDRYLRVGKSVMNEDRKIVPAEYGTANFKSGVGVGGFAMAPADYVRFLSVLHAGDGKLLKPQTVNSGDNIKWHGGLLAGAVSYVEHFDNGITLAIFFNKSVPEDYGLRIRDIMNALPDSAWPAAPFDLFPDLGIR